MVQLVQPLGHKLLGIILIVHSDWNPHTSHPPHCLVWQSRAHQQWLIIQLFLLRLWNRIALLPKNIKKTEPDSWFSAWEQRIIHACSTMTRQVSHRRMNSNDFLKYKFNIPVDLPWFTVILAIRVYGLSLLRRFKLPGCTRSHSYVIFPADHLTFAWSRFAVPRALLLRAVGKMTVRESSFF